MRVDVTGSVSFLACILSISVTSGNEALNANNNQDVSNISERSGDSSMANDSSKYVEVIETTTHTSAATNTSSDDHEQLKPEEKSDSNKNSNLNLSVTHEDVLANRQNSSSTVHETRKFLNSNDESQPKLSEAPSTTGFDPNVMLMLNNPDPNTDMKNFAQTDMRSAYPYNTGYLPHIRNTGTIPFAATQMYAPSPYYKAGEGKSRIQLPTVIDTDSYNSVGNPNKKQYFSPSYNTNSISNLKMPQFEESLYNNQMQTMPQNPNRRVFPPTNTGKFKSHNLDHTPSKFNPVNHFSQSQSENSAPMVNSISRTVNSYDSDELPIPLRLSIEPNDIQTNNFAKPRGIQITGSEYPQLPYNPHSGPMNIQMDAMAVPPSKDVKRVPEYTSSHNLNSRSQAPLSQPLLIDSVHPGHENVLPYKHVPSNFKEPTLQDIENAEYNAQLSNLENNSRFMSVNSRPELISDLMINSTNDILHPNDDSLRLRKTRRNEMILPYGHNNYQACSSEGEFYNAWNDMYQCMVCVCIKQQGLLILTCASCSGCTQQQELRPPYVPKPVMTTMNPPLVRPPPNSCYPLPTKKPFRHPGNPCLACTCMNIVEDMFGEVVPQISCEKLEDCPYPAPPTPNKYPSEYVVCEKMPNQVWFPHPTDACGVCQCTTISSQYGAMENMLQCRDIPNCSENSLYSSSTQSDSELVLSSSLVTAPPTPNTMMDGCFPLPFNVVFRHPLNSCQICKCERAQDVDGTTTRLITCQVIQDCMNMEIIEYPPSAYVNTRQLPIFYPHCQKFPSGILFPHPTEDCNWCKCGHQYSPSGMMEPTVVCYHEENCQSFVTPSFSPVTAPSSLIVQNLCLPFPENTLFKHPLNPCMLCYCAVGSYDAEIKCTSIKSCQTSEPIPMLPSGPFPQPYESCVQFPDAIEFPHPSEACKVCTCNTHAHSNGFVDAQILCYQDSNCTLPWPPDVDPLPPPRPHESCAPYPPDQPFQHPWNECQVCKCWEARSESGINVQVTCYTKPECCVEDLPSVIQSPAPKDIVITDQTCEFRTFGMQFTHPRDSCKQCVCALSGRYVYLQCKTLNNPRCMPKRNEQQFWEIDASSMENNGYGFASAEAQVNIDDYSPNIGLKPGFPFSSNPATMKPNSWGSPVLQQVMYTGPRGLASELIDQMTVEPNSYESDLSMPSYIVSSKDELSNFKTNKQMAYVTSNPMYAFNEPATLRMPLNNAYVGPLQQSSNVYNQYSPDFDSYLNDKVFAQQGNQYKYSQSSKYYPSNSLAEASASSYDSLGYGLQGSQYAPIYDSQYNNAQFSTMYSKSPKPSLTVFQTTPGSKSHSLGSNAQSYAYASKYNNADFERPSGQHSGSYSSADALASFQQNNWQSGSSQASSMAQASAQAGIMQRRGKCKYDGDKYHHRCQVCLCREDRKGQLVAACFGSPCS